jgi:hypothetical protein
MFEIIKIGAPVFIAIWFIITFSMTIVCAVEKDNVWNPPCQSPMIRLEYIFPGRQLGCWLGEPVTEAKTTIGKK